MNQRHATTLRAAAAILLLVALGSVLPASGNASAARDARENAGGAPMARMLIPARMRMIVRFSPSRTA